MVAYIGREMDHLNMKIYVQYLTKSLQAWPLVFRRQRNHLRLHVTRGSLYKILWKTQKKNSFFPMTLSYNMEIHLSNYREILVWSKFYCPVCEKFLLLDKAPCNHVEIIVLRFYPCQCSVLEPSAEHAMIRPRPRCTAASWAFSSQLLFFC